MVVERRLRIKMIFKNVLKINHEGQVDKGMDQQVI